MDVNLTSAFIDMIKSTSAVWTEDYYQQFNEITGDRKKRAPFVPYVLRNETGEVLKSRREEGRETSPALNKENVFVQTICLENS